MAVTRKGDLSKATSILPSYTNCGGKRSPAIEPTKQGVIYLLLPLLTKFTLLFPCTVMVHDAGGA